MLIFLIISQVNVFFKAAILIINNLEIYILNSLKFSVTKTILDPPSGETCQPTSYSEGIPHLVLIIMLDYLWPLGFRFIHEQAGWSIETWAVCIALHLSLILFFCFLTVLTTYDHWIKLVRDGGTQSKEKEKSLHDQRKCIRF